MIVFIAEVDVVALPGWAWTVGSAVIGGSITALLARAIASLDKKIEDLEDLTSTIRTEITKHREDSLAAHSTIREDLAGIRAHQRIPPRQDGD